MSLSRDLNLRAIEGGVEWRYLRSYHMLETILWSLHILLPGKPIIAEESRTQGHILLYPGAMAFCGVCE